MGCQCRSPYLISTLRFDACFGELMAKRNSKKKPWYAEGLRFECQGSGKCCSSRGQYGYVYLTTEDRKNMAKHLNLSLTRFTERFCRKSDGHYHLIENWQPGVSGGKPVKSPDCLFLDGTKCTVYEARPSQCRTWPF